MKRISFLLVVCLMTCTLFTGCQEEAEEEILTRPLIKFTDDIKETSESVYNVSVSITSDQDLKEVKIEKIFPAKDESDEEIETVATFTDPKRYSFEREFTAPATVQKMQIVFNAVTVKGLSSSATFTFNTEQSAFSQSAIINALADAYAVFETTDELPDEITVNDVVFNKAAYYEAACKILLNIRAGSDASITLSDYTHPGSPDSDTFVETEVPIELLENQSTRQLNFANANDGVFANYVGYPQNFVGPNGETYNGQFSFNRSAVVLARALAYYKTNGSLPATLSSSYQVEISQKPISVWMWGSVLSNEDIQTVVNKLAQNNVTKVYLLVKGTAGTRTPADKLTDFITKAHTEEIEVHLWFMINEDAVYIAANPNAGIYHCPKPSESTDPYPMNDDRVNLLYPGYKEYVLEHIAYFLTNFDCDGIHLDGIRFGHFVYSFDQYSLQRAASSGCNTTRLLSFFDTEPNYTTYATNNGFVNLYINEDQDVVKWVNMRKDVILAYIEAVKETIEQLKPGLKLSAAFMPEGVTDPKYADVFYAQNYALHSTVLDMISPMAYFKAYGKATNWLQTITQGAKNLVDPQCEIYSGVQGYDGVTASQLNEQIQYSFNGGAQGIIVFRYGTITEDSWTVIKEWGK